MTTTDSPRSSVAVVTGAGNGLGRAITRALLDDGHMVVLAGRTRASLQDTAADHPRAEVVVADVTSASSVRALFASAWALHGRVDVLVNNAGVFGPEGAIDEVEDGHWHDVLAANVTGSFLCAREAVRIMRRQRPRGGRIINSGSLSAHVPRPHSVAYTVSKHAITGLTAAMNLDLRDHGIACTQLDVGNAATAMTAGIGVEALQPDGTRRAEPTIDPVDVARLVAHVVSLPLEVNVPSLTVMARTMPYAGRG
ncbi:SDR family oxidoreductase [Actinoallomurus iriomotensis]|uniref:3-oxoacyl-ACP reductase n=1 Tax=Actinoallomurus iriomotensis TaxID=478107 RepID=A0A9W6VNN0_9ACTN|nr:SDR family oxidoreductase [Actinoallomurus iriomotensis]GLY78968.1 3-oxoacyl-ACP reductase [Actinoallomurus iriomotensis]